MTKTNIAKGAKRKRRREAYDIQGGLPWHTISPDGISSSGRCWPARFRRADSAALLRCRSLGYKSPNEKLNIASIGAGGKAASDIDGCASENIVALCDVDEKQAARKVQGIREGAEVQRLPPDARRAGQRHRRRHRDHSGFHARHRGALRAWSAASTSTCRSR